MKCRIFLYIVVTSLLTACNFGQNKILEHAYNIMDDDPDSAMIVLKTIDSRDLNNERDKALFALLYSQALEKTNQIVTNDSLIRIAVDYFATQNDCREKMLAYYYLGCIKYHGRLFLQSLKASLVAKKIAGEIGDYYYLGLIGYNLMDIYNSTHSYTKSLQVADETIEAFKKAGKDMHLDWAVYEKTVVLFSLNSMEKFKSLLDSISYVANKKNYTALTNNCNQMYVDYFVYSKDEAERDSVAFYYNMLQNPSELETLSMVNYYLSKDQLDSARIYLDKTGQSNSQYYYNLHNYFLSKYEYKKGNKDTAYDLLNKTLVEFDSLYNSLSRIDIDSYQSDFYQQEMREAKAKDEKRQIIYIFVLAFLLLMFSTSIYFYRNLIRKREEELAKTIEAAEGLKEQLSYSSKTTEEMKRKINSLLLNQFETLKDLFRSYYEMPTDKTAVSTLSKRVKDIISTLTQKDKVNEIEAAINQETNNSIYKLFADAEKAEIVLSERERVLLIYLMSGFPPSTISVLLEVSNSNYYTTKSRLKNKLMAIDTNEAKEIIANYF